MNAFADAAAQAADTGEVNITALVQRFLQGTNGKSGNVQSLDGTLYDGSTVVARRSKTGTVILGSNSLKNTELNDSLIGQIYSRGIFHTRLASFDTLLSPADRTNDLRGGRYNDFGHIAGIVGFEYSQADIDAVERAKNFTKRVTEFFTKLEKEEADRIKSQAEKERLARIAAQAIEWDKGTGSHSNSSITGAGGKGHRLRPSKDKKSLYSSGGYSLTVTQAKVGWEFATKRWHGDTPLRYNSDSRSLGNSYNARRITVYNDRLEVGCQTIYKEEAERIADVMGWARAEKKAK